jgi:TonB-linked SusC/RagA family outer membrane protein
MELYIHGKHYLYKLLKTLILLALPTAIFAQNVGTPLINSRQEGIVVDSLTKQPIAGVTLQIKGVTHSVSTGPDGRFAFITGQRLPYTLIVTYIGYKTKEVPVDGTPVTISLSDAVSQLGEVVVVGYGTQRKSDLTGAVASVPKALLNQPAASFDNLLQGGVSGVAVTQNSGQPGSTATIRVRGGNSISFGNAPLYVIDGFIIYNDNSYSNVGANGISVNALSTINPDDIESIEVLKDASATAIYGSHGANGVVIITTKRGKKGTNNVNFNAYYGTQRVSKTLDLLNASQWESLVNDENVSDGTTPTFSASQIASAGAGSNWQAAALRTAPVQNDELTFSGGDEKSRYLVSGDYFNQQGTIINTGFKRYSGRVNYERNVSEHFKLTANVFGSQSVENKLYGSPYGSINFSNAYATLLTTSPLAQIRNTDGSYNISNPYLATPTNPIQDIASTINQTTLDRLLGNVAGEYKFAKDLTLKVSFGADLLNTTQDYYAPSYTASPAGSSNGYSAGGYASVGSGNELSWLNENTLTYDHNFNDTHFLNVLVGYTTQYTQFGSDVASAQKFPNDLLTYKNLAYATLANLPTSSYSSQVLDSYLGRINYSFEHKYNLTVSIRADGSSKLGSNNKWGYFPSAGFSWNIDKEKFFEKLEPNFSSLKLRLTAGQTGNSEVPPYSSLSALAPTNYYFSGKLVTGIAPIQLANPDLKWETTTQYDGGLDFGFFDNRITFTFDAYYKKTTNLLLNVPLPLYTGYASELENVGSVQNKGVELGINAENIKSDGFSWKTNIQFAANQNKVLSLGQGVSSFFPIAPTGQVSPVIVQVGLPVGTFWGYSTNGLLTASNIANGTPLLAGVPQQAGDTKYVDYNHDGKITTADKHNLGSAQPKFTGSITNTFTLGRFDLLVFFQGSYGSKIFNLLQQTLERPTLSLNASATLLNRWTPQNTNTTVARATDSPVPQVTDRYIENGSYLKLKNASLGYTFSNALASKIHAKLIRVSVSGQNLLTITKYTGLDPEVNFYDNDNTKQGIDYGTYPPVRTFLAGLNVTF